MKKVVLMILIMVLAVLLTAETSGEYGFQMLKISAGATLSAQGGTGAFFSNDACGGRQPAAPDPCKISLSIRAFAPWARPDPGCL